MELNKNVIAKINQGRDQTEASFVFSLWKDLQLYDDYKDLNRIKDKFLHNEDAQFYFALGYAIREKGFQTCDNITLDAYLEGKPSSREKFESLGGWPQCQALINLVNSENIDAYYDQIRKMNILEIMYKKSVSLFDHIEKFDKSTSEDVYDTFELLNNSVALETGLDSKIESLVIDEKFIEECNKGIDVGLNYGAGAPILNYVTLGVPVGDIYLLAAHSGVGKTSFIFENMVLPIASDGTKVAIISNEMTIKSYKNLLLVHVLSHDLNYWKITRKKLKIGHFSDEEMSMLKKASKITKEKYSNIIFVKMFENNNGKLLKYIKRLARTGVKMIAYDTMKADDSLSQDMDMWQQLLMDSRRIFNIVNRENIAFVATFQLALHSLNQRYLDSSCLSSSKQIKEVVSELVLMRQLRTDEYTGERFDCHPWRYNKDNSKIKDQITLDSEKKYVVCFVDKTRNDMTGQCILYQWDGGWNKWVELGYCTIVNEYKN